MTNDPTEGSEQIMVEGVAHGFSDEAVGEMCGKSARTVRRRRGDPEFAARVAAVSQRRVDEITSRLGELSRSALDVLRDAMLPGQPMKVRLAASSSTLRNMRDFHSSAEIERRLVEMERILAEVAPLLEVEDQR